MQGRRRAQGARVHVRRPAERDRADREVDQRRRPERLHDAVRLRLHPELGAEDGRWCRVLGPRRSCRRHRRLHRHPDDRDRPAGHRRQRQHRRRDPRLRRRARHGRQRRRVVGARVPRLLHRQRGVAAARTEPRLARHEHARPVQHDRHCAWSGPRVGGRRHRRQGRDARLRRRPRVPGRDHRADVPWLPAVPGQGRRGQVTASFAP